MGSAPIMSWKILHVKLIGIVIASSRTVYRCGMTWDLSYGVQRQYLSLNENFWNYIAQRKKLYNIHDSGIKWIFQLRVGLSPLKSHKKAHHFQDTPYDTCNCSLRVAETTCHFLLHCSNFIVQRNVLFNVKNPILRSTPFLADEELVHLLLYGNEKFKFEDNQNILIATIEFIRNTSRFSQT